MRQEARRARRVFVAVALCSLLVAACADRGKPAWEFEGRVSRSRFWEYHDRSDEPLCPTLLDQLDEHTLAVGGLLGLEVEETRPLRYYKLAYKSELTVGCPSGVDACAAGDTVLAASPFMAHEQVHTYVSRAWGNEAVGLLTEGVAVALSCDPLPSSMRGVTPRENLGADDWRPFLYLYGNSVSGYKAAGYFVTYLARRFGWQKVEQLHHRALPGLSTDDFAIEFARVFPISVDQAWAEALGGDSPPCDSGWSCSGVVMGPGDSAQAACDGELHRLIEVSDQPGVVLTYRWPVLLQDCADPLAPPYELVPGRYRPTTAWAHLPPGRYRIFSDPLPTSDITFVSYLPSPFMAADCTQAGKVTLRPGQTNSVDLLPGTMDGCLLFDGADQSYGIYPFYVDLSAPASAVLCESRDPAAPCVPLAARAWTTVTIGAEATLRLQQAKSAPPPSRSFAELLIYPASSVDGGT